MTPAEPALDQLRRDPLPLRGRVALVTGVSRRAGIGYAIARRLAQAFAAQHDDSRPGGRIVLMTSGQDLGPMPGEVAYAASKGALASITQTLADQLAGRGITLNTVNPGPVDTGYAPPDAHEIVRRHFPQGRWGTPDDPARLIAWLVTDDAAWITGQVINSEGGFRRWD